MNWKEIVFQKQTKKHVKKVSELISKVIVRLYERSMHHDDSKFKKPEKELFIEYTPKLKGTTYGSAEYLKCLEGLKPALIHHYANNRHHPEYFNNDVSKMDLIDIIEMIVDWKSASLRHADGDILKSIEYNQKKFGFSDDLKNILINTIENFGWVEHK